MSGLIDSVFNVFDSILGGGDEPQAQPASAAAANIPPPPDMTPFYTQMQEQQTALQTQMAQQQESFQKTLMEQSAAADQRQAEALAAQTTLLTPKTMPTPTSSDVRGAKRKAVASMRARRGRDSTILSDTDTLGG